MQGGTEVEGSEEARRRALLAALPDLMFRLRRDGTYLEFAGDVTGLATPADELVGANVHDILPAPVAGPLLAAVERALATGSPVSTEYSLHRLTDGALREFEARCAPVSGVADEVVAIVRDVTDARRMTREQDSLRRIATLVASGVGESELVSAIAKEIAALFDADAANALRWDGTALHVVGEWRSDRRPDPAARVFLYGGDTISARIVETAAPARVDSFEDLATEFARERWLELGIGASIGAPVNVRGGMWGVVTASRVRDRDPFPGGSEQRLADFATLLAQAIENAESRLEMTRVVDEQTSLRRIATLVAGGRPYEEVLEQVTSEVGRLFEAAEVHVVRWEGVMDEVVVVQAWAAEPARAAEPGERLREPHGGAVIAVLEQGLSANVVDDEKAVVAAPLIINGVLRGALAARRGAEEPFPNAADVRLRAFGDLAAQSIGNDHTQRALRESRARIVREGDEARRRFERNLHDGAQQRLVAVSMTLRHAATLFEKDAARAQELVSAAATELGHALQELRDLARGLHPAILSDQGLSAALRALVLRAPIETVLENQIEHRLPDAVEAAAYYVASECLTNAAKYARSDSVRITARVATGGVVLEVVDSGVGGATITPGSGLQGLTDRVEAIGGHLDVHSPAGLGTTIRAVIPLVPP